MRAAERHASTRKRIERDRPSFEKAYAHIARHPLTGSPRYAHELNLPGLRCGSLARYPWLVFYVEHPDRIDVWRVLHEQRDIPAWMQQPDGR